MRLWTAIKMTLVLTLLTGIIYPVLMVVIGDNDFPLPGARQPGHPRRPCRRLAVDRAEFQRSGLLSSAPVGRRQRLRRD